MLLLDSAYYLKALAAGDAWVAVGYSHEILPFAMRTPGVTVVAPASGTTLWADVWTLPAARAGTLLNGRGVGSVESALTYACCVGVRSGSVAAAAAVVRLCDAAGAGGPGRRAEGARSVGWHAC